jgi:hypothetical protein
LDLVVVSAEAGSEFFSLDEADALTLVLERRAVALPRHAQERGELRSHVST